MVKGIAALPAVEFTEQQIMNGTFPGEQARRAQEHGPIYKWSITAGPEAGTDFVFMVGAEANRFVLHTHREHFSHDLGWTPLIGESLGKGLLNMDDPEHARHRKMWNPAFTSACMEAYLPVIQQVIAERTGTWPARGEIDLYSEAREITFDAAAAALAGFQRGAEVDRLRELFYTLLHGFDPGENSFEAFVARIMAARDELAERMLVAIAARRGLPATEQTHDVLGMIVRARDEQGQALSDEQVLAHLNILLVAGHETTTTLSAWVLYELAQQPAARARVQAELDAVLGPPTGNPPSPEALRGLKVLDNFIRETGRLYPPVLNVPRGVVRDFEFGGYTIPAGTPVRLAIAAGHRLPAAFADPDRFDPDRFAPPREEDKRTPYSLVTFGGGSRICIGVNFANIEVKALAAHVLRTYELTPVPGQHPVQAGHWTGFIPGGIRMRARARG
ncbi:MAG TPA: cytochrome P450 [Chloroflexia bacterium]|nr:cytochrome P450 [Chloroflexia bacterium]